MKVQIEPYNRDWINQYKFFKDELSEILQDLNPEFEHFGSTSIPGLAAKPIIDILVGIEKIESLGDVVKLMAYHPNYIYYEVYNEIIPDRRFFIRLKDGVDQNRFEKIYSDMDSIPHEELHKCRIAHIHVWQYKSSEWKRHIDFRDYLKTNPEARKEYEALKITLSKKEWKDGNEYAKAKTSFVEKIDVKLKLSSNKSGISLK